MKKRYAVMLTPKQINKMFVIIDKQIELDKECEHIEEIKEICQEWIKDLQEAKTQLEKTWDRIPPWWN